MQTLLALAPTTHSKFPRGALVTITSDEGDTVHFVCPGDTAPTCTTLTGFVRLPPEVSPEDPRTKTLAAEVAVLGDFDIGQDHVDRLVKIALGSGS